MTGSSFPCREMNRLMTAQRYPMSVCVCSSSLATDYHSHTNSCPFVLPQVSLPISIRIFNRVQTGMCAVCAVSPFAKEPRQGQCPFCRCISNFDACGDWSMRISTFHCVSERIIKVVCETVVIRDGTISRGRWSSTSVQIPHYECDDE